MDRNRSLYIDACSAVHAMVRAVKSFFDTTSFAGLDGAESIKAPLSMVRIDFDTSIFPPSENYYFSRAKLRHVYIFCSFCC